MEIPRADKNQGSFILHVGHAGMLFILKSKLTYAPASALSEGPGVFALCLEERLVSLDEER